MTPSLKNVTAKSYVTWKKAIATTPLSERECSLNKFVLGQLSSTSYTPTTTQITIKMSHATHRSTEPLSHVIINANDELQCQQAKRREFLASPPS